MAVQYYSSHQKELHLKGVNISPFPGGDRFLVQTYLKCLFFSTTDFVKKEKSDDGRGRRIERQEAREDVVKMIGIAVLQFANAIAGGNNTNMLAVFSPRHKPLDLKA